MLYTFDEPPLLPALEATPWDDLAGLLRRSYGTVHYAGSRSRVSTDDRQLLSLADPWEALLLAAANPGAQVSVVDPDPLRIKQTERRLRYHGFWQGDYHLTTRLETVPGSFDFIDAGDALAWVADPLVALQTWRSRLKPDGILYLRLYSRYGCQTLMNLRESLVDLGVAKLPVAQACREIRQLANTLTPPLPLPSPELQLARLYLYPGLNTYSLGDVFALLKQADLGILNLVDFPAWTHPAVSPDLELGQRLQVIERLGQHPYLELWLEPQDARLALPWDDWLGATVQLNPLLRQSPRLMNLWQQAVTSQGELRFPWAGIEVTITASDLQALASLNEGHLVVDSHTAPVVSELEDLLVLQRL